MDSAKPTLFPVIYIVHCYKLVAGIAGIFTALNLQLQNLYIFNSCLLSCRMHIGMTFFRAMLSCRMHIGMTLFRAMLSRRMHIGMTFFRAMLSCRMHIGMTLFRTMLYVACISG